MFSSFVVDRRVAVKHGNTRHLSGYRQLGGLADLDHCKLGDRVRAAACLDQQFDEITTPAVLSGAV
jgi:hypothetical protein